MVSSIASNVGGAVLYVVLPANLAGLAPRLVISPLSKCQPLLAPHLIRLESNWVSTCLEKVKVKLASHFQEVWLSHISTELDLGFNLPDRVFSLSCF